MSWKCSLNITEHGCLQTQVLQLYKEWQRNQTQSERLAATSVPYGYKITTEMWVSEVQVPGRCTNRSLNIWMPAYCFWWQLMWIQSGVDGLVKPGLITGGLEIRESQPTTAQPSASKGDHRTLVWMQEAKLYPEWSDGFSAPTPAVSLFTVSPGFSFAGLSITGRGSKTVADCWTHTKFKEGRAAL